MKKLKLTNGVSFGGKYTVTAEDIAQSAVAEVITLTITEGCGVDGNVTVTLRGGTPVNIAVTTTADTPAEVATLVAAGTFTGWTQVADGADVVFTASAAGVKTGANTFAVASTGVVGSLAITTLGAAAIDGSVTFDFCSQQTEDPVDYNIAPAFTVVNSSNVFQPLTDAVITRPAVGQVKIADGSTFKLDTGDIIYIVAQRSVEVE